MLTLRDRIYYNVLPAVLGMLEPIERGQYNEQKLKLPIATVTGDNHLFLTHGRGGGVDKFVEDSAAIIEADNKKAWILYFHPLKRKFFLSDRKIHTGSTRLSFRFPSEYKKMVAHLQSLGLKKLHVNHTRYLPFYFLKDLPEFAQTLGIPYDYTLHDFFSFCPRVHLIDNNFRYCGMPQDATLCTGCVKKNGRMASAPKDANQWRDLNRFILGKASELIAPSHDTAERHKRILGIEKIKVVPHDFPQINLRTFPAKQKNEPYTIAVVGRIHRHKGADVLMACVKDAQKRNLPLRFSIIGTSPYNKTFKQLGVHVTGIYQEEELSSLLEQSKASLVFLPSLWPETYSYVLSHIWHNSYFPVVFDLGAPAERIKEAGNGLTLPFGMVDSTSAINDALLEAAKKQHSSN